MNFNLSDFTLTDAILPYFGGTAGEACRLAAVAYWEKQNTTFQQELNEVMMTDLYKTAKSYCQPQIDSYNIASGVVCVLQQKLKGDYNMTYGQFWQEGNVYFDGDYDLATMFSQTSNFTLVGGISTCFADCYTGVGPGCDEFKSFIPNYGKVSIQDYCSLAWGGIDTQYNEIKLCAAKAIGEPSNTNLTKLDYVNIFRYQSATQKQCAYQYCYPVLGEEITNTSCPSNKTSSSGSNPASTSGADINKWWRSGAIVLLVFGWLASNF